MSRKTIKSRALTKLLADVAKKYGVTVDELRSPRKHRPLPAIRAEFCRLAWALNQHSAPQIAYIINRDHTTVMHALGMRKKKPSYPHYTHDAAYRNAAE